jgi:hypothetical protein
LSALFEDAFEDGESLHTFSTPSLIHFIEHFTESPENHFSLKIFDRASAGISGELTPRALPNKP